MVFGKQMGFRLAAGVLALASVVGGGGIALAQQAQPAGQSVSIVNFAFEPAELTVPAGTRVTWTNNGEAPHTASSTDNAFDSGRLASGASFSFTFNTPGSFPYQCNIHPRMLGRITVQAAAGGAAQATATRTATAVAPAGGAQPTATRPPAASGLPRTGAGVSGDGAGAPTAMLAATAILALAGAAGIGRFCRRN